MNFVLIFKITQGQFEFVATYFLSSSFCFATYVTSD